MDRSAPVRARPTSSRVPVPASRAASSAESSRKEELVGSLRARINALEAENRILQADNEKLTKRCKELKERGATLSSSRKQLLEQLNAFKAQHDQTPQPTTETEASREACEECAVNAAKMAQTHERCQHFQQQVEYLSRKLEEQPADTPPGFVHEDYTREVISSMLGQMVERTASKFYKGRIVTLEQEVQAAQNAIAASNEQVDSLQQTVQLLSSEAAKLTEFEADEQNALKFVISEKEAALKIAETQLRELEQDKTTAEMALQTARTELDSAVNENQHLRVQVELMESAIEAEEANASRQSQEAQTDEIQEEPKPDERDSRIEQLEAKIRALNTELKLANAVVSQAKENQDTMRRFCMVQFPSAPGVRDL